LSFRANADLSVKAFTALDATKGRYKSGEKDRVEHCRKILKSWTG